jgi:GST-like protein
MACYPWIAAHQKQGQQLDAFPALARWAERVAARPATLRAYALADNIINAAAEKERGNGNSAEP